MQFRCGAFLLTLLLVAAPTIGAFCEFACPAPPVRSVSTCHDGSAERDAMAMRGDNHACGDTHVDSLPAIGAVDTSRARTEASGTLMPWSPAAVHVKAAHILTGPAVHGPPGSIVRSAQTLTTILRI